MGAYEFHFLRGGEAYKYAWGAVDRPNTPLTLATLARAASERKELADLLRLTETNMDHLAQVYAARVLRPGGTTVIFNFFVTAVTRRPIAATSSGWPAPTGCRRAGTRDFILWDGLTFLLTLPARRE